MAPTLEDMHEFGGNMSFEDTIMMSLNFTSDAWLCAIGQVPSYGVYMAELGQESAMRYHKRVLKLLQWRNPRKHWALKDVYHLSRLPALFATYPDACVVWCRRDPVRASASLLNMLGTMQWVGSDNPLQHGARAFDAEVYGNGDPTTYGLPLDLYDQLRTEMPCDKVQFEHPLLIDEVWCVSRHEDMSAILTDNARFRSSINVPLITRFRTGGPGRAARHLRAGRRHPSPAPQRARQGAAPKGSDIQPAGPISYVKGNLTRGVYSLPITVTPAR